MNNTIKQAYAESQLSFLDVVIRRWFSILDEYGEIGNFDHDKTQKTSDVPYYYNERATLSTFVGALWKSGYNCLEEFATMKSLEKEKPRNGRGDLYFYNSNYTDTIEYYVEAKQKFISLERNKNEVLTTSFNKALNDAKAHDPSSGTRLGFLFATPISKKEISEDSLENFINQCDELPGKLAIGHYYPKEVRSLKGVNDYFYPGVSIIIGKV